MNINVFFSFRDVLDSLEIERTRRGNMQVQKSELQWVGIFPDD